MFDHRITLEINDFIRNEGKGDIRDALNVALTRLTAAKKEIEYLKQENFILTRRIIEHIKGD